MPGLLDSSETDSSSIHLQSSSSLVRSARPQPSLWVASVRFDSGPLQSALRRRRECSLLNEPCCLFLELESRPGAGGVSTQGRVEAAYSAFHLRPPAGDRR